MHAFIWSLLALALGAAAAADAPWHLVFADEFCCTGPAAPSRAGSGPFSAGGVDLSTWQFELGNNGGWGNGEPQVYTDLADNAEVTTDPTGTRCALRIRAIDLGGGSYTSARMRSSPHPVAGDIVYPPGGAVRVEAALWLPRGSASGTWPAFWMFPKDEAYGRWPASGEIDIMEAVKGQRDVFASLHFGSSAAPRMKQAIVGCADCNAGWHTYALEWREGSLTWFLDGREVLRATEADFALPGRPAVAPFDRGFHVVLNLAAGGAHFAGTPSPDFGEQSFWVDYVRVYKTVPPTGGPVPGACAFEERRAARACWRRGLDYAGLYDVGSLAVPAEFQATRARFCAQVMFNGTRANAVFVTTGQRGWPWDNHCWFKNVPPLAAPPTPNDGYPNGTLVVLKGVGAICPS